MVRSLFAKSPMIAGALLLTIGVVSAPAQATLLFSFNTTNPGESGSFTLDPSATYIPPTSPSPYGLLLNAISDFTISNVNGQNFGPLALDLTTTSDKSFLTGQPVTGFGIIFDPLTADAVAMNFSDTDLITKLSDNPNDYTSSFIGGIVEKFGSNTIDAYIPQIDVKTVPAPNATVGMLAFGAFVVGSHLKRKMIR